MTDWSIKQAFVRWTARRRLERALGMDRAQSRLLARLALGIGEEDHTCLLIGRGCFEEAVTKADLAHEDLVRVERIRSRVFGGPRREAR
jgi:hypothetical protein